MVARNDSVALFYDRFINYGFNKIEYVETLRLEGYRFLLAGNMFAFDLPHLPYFSFSFFIIVPSTMQSTLRIVLPKMQ